MSARIVYTCSECGTEYLDGYAPGTARLSVRAYDGRMTELDWCRPECFERGIIRAGERMVKRRTVQVEQPANNIRQLPPRR